MTQAQTRDLTAARIGDLAAARLALLPEEGASGCVEAVYRRAVSVAVEGQSGPGGSGRGCGSLGWAISLLPAVAPLHPYAVTVWERWGSGAGEAACRESEGEAGFLGARLGEGVALGRGAIEFGEGRLSVALDAAEVWDSRLRTSADGRRPCGTARTRVSLRQGVRAAMTARQPDSHFLRALLPAVGAGVHAAVHSGSLIAEATRRRVEGLREVLERGQAPDSGALAPILMDFIGFGEGLTPSGDDFLIGLEAAAGLMPGAGSDALDAALAAVAPAVAGATTRESARMLEAAAAGHYPEPVVGLLGAAAAGDEGGVRRWVDCLENLGATSGQDMLAGVLFWLSDWDREDRRGASTGRARVRIDPRVGRTKGGVS